MLSKKKPQDRVDPEYLVGLDTASAQPAPASVKPFIKKHWKPITAAICAAAVAAAVLVPKNSAKPAAASAQYVETRPEKRNIVNSYSADGTITAADSQNELTGVLAQADGQGYCPDRRLRGGRHGQQRGESPAFSRPGPEAATTTPWMPSTSAALSVAQSLP